MKRFVCCLIVLISMPLTLSAAAKYPFPQNVKYPYGIAPSSVDAAKVQNAFDDFMKLYVENGNVARIRHDDTTKTVSEGIGYGMLIMVYMDNATNNTQGKFDKLWAFYNQYLDTAGLMNWKINGFSGPTADGRNAATDADLDVAVSLMEAYKQWGDEKYLNDAKTMIAKIYKRDVNKNGYLKPGDSWDTEKNPSYFSTAALQLFKNVSDSAWDNVRNNSYSLLKKVMNANTGLIPNWCSEQGSPSGGNRGYFTYDAIRTPWRLAWAYSWYGHQDAKDICGKIASWISAKTNTDPKKIVDGYQLDGTATSQYNNATFVGPLGCAGMVDNTNQAWVDTSFKLLSSMSEKVYYQVSLKIITLLYLSGNMPDFWSGTSVLQPKNIAKPSDSHRALAFNLSADKKLSFSTATSGKVEISLYTVTGQRATIAANGYFEAGSHCVALNPSLTKGTYIVKIKANGGEVSGKVSVVK